MLQNGLELGAISAVVMLAANLWEWPKLNLVQVACTKVKREYNTRCFRS